MVSGGGSSPPGLFLVCRGRTFCTPAHFMWLQGHRRPGQSLAIDESEAPRTSTAAHDPALIAENRGAQTYAGLRLPLVRMQHRWRKDSFEQGVADRIHLDDGARSRAVVFCRPPHTVHQWGPGTCGER